MLISFSLFSALISGSFAVSLEGLARTAPSVKCPSGWQKLEQKCFRLSVEKVSFDDAFLSCTSQGATLASITNKQEQEFLASLANKELTWLGGTDRAQQKRFSWLDGQTWIFTNWASPNQPNHKPRQDCVELRKDGYWDDVVCSKSLPYICQQHPCTGVCPNGWVQEGCSCFQVFREQKLPWKSARDRCRLEGGDLASVKSQAIQDTLMTSEEQDDFWIGLHDEKIEGYFTWSTGDPIGPYTNWQSFPVAQPNAKSAGQDYVKVRGGSGGWDDVSGGASLKFACQILLADSTQHDEAPSLGLGTRIAFPGLSCEPGWMLHLSSCYSMQTQPSSWDDAQTLCSQLGAQLGAVTDIDIAILVHELLPAEDFWIGANDRANEQSFAWANGSPWNWSNWNRNQPNHKDGQHCVKVKSKTNKWDDISCAKKLKFLCQKGSNGLNK